MTDAPTALVVGGSVGGLFAARLLHRAGWRAKVFERSAGDLAGRGAGVGITRELLQVMAACGTPLDRTIGLSVRSFVWRGSDGAVRFEHPRPMGSSAWVRIYKALRDGFPESDHANGKTLVRVDQVENEVLARFADGTTARGDLLVAADGAHSTVRAQLLPDVVPQDAGYVAWRGVVAREAISAEAQAEIDGHITFSFAAGEMMLTMPVPGLEPGASGGRYYFIWYRPVADAAAMADLFIDETGRDHGRAIPPPDIRAEHRQALHRDVRALFAPSVAAVVAAVVTTGQPMLQAISDLASPKLDHGRVALLGDAAFVARPHVAGGITKAALDAQALVEALRTHPGEISAALAAYDTQQRAFGNDLVAHARFLGGYVESHGAAPDPETVMRRYGAPHLLHDPDPDAFLSA